MVESGGLENRCTLTGTVGSNPTLTATPMLSYSIDKAYTFGYTLGVGKTAKIDTKGRPDEAPQKHPRHQESPPRPRPLVVRLSSP